jgi:hypothetical protein
MAGARPSAGLLELSHLRCASMRQNVLGHDKLSLQTLPEVRTLATRLARLATQALVLLAVAPALACILPAETKCNHFCYSKGVYYVCRENM